jgi:hypothetical protein
MTTNTKVISKWCDGEVIDKLDPEGEDKTQNQEDMHLANHENYVFDQAALDTSPTSSMHRQWVSSECFSRKIQLQWNETAAQLQQERDT